MEKKKQSDRPVRMDPLLSSDAVLAINAEGIIKFANQEACELTERTMNELIGESIVEVYASIELAREANRKIYRAGGTIHNLESKTKTKSGKIIPVRISASHLYDSDRKYIGGVGYFARQKQGIVEGFVEEAQIKARVEQLETKIENWKKLASGLGKISKEAIRSWIKSYPLSKKR
jgi:PAS domain S-box-containing protein